MGRGRGRGREHSPWKTASSDLGHGWHSRWQSNDHGSDRITSRLGVIIRGVTSDLLTLVTMMRNRCRRAQPHTLFSFIWHTQYATPISKMQSAAAREKGSSGRAMMGSGPGQLATVSGGLVGWRPTSGPSSPSPSVSHVHMCVTWRALLDRPRGGCALARVVSREMGRAWLHPQVCRTRSRHSLERDTTSTTTPSPVSESRCPSHHDAMLRPIGQDHP